MTCLAQRLAEAGEAARRRFTATLDDRHVQAIHVDWRLWARDEQWRPPGNWRTWLIMAGRGFGKTRAGAAWVNERAMAGDTSTRIALVGATIDEARAVMVEGESGVLAASIAAERPEWKATQRRLVWPTGAQAELFSGARPEGLRGPSHAFAWCDEIAKWARPQATWDNLQMTLRIGTCPRAVVTTTPRPIALLRAMMDDGSVAVTRGTTHDNVHLPERFVAAMTDAHAGTRWGRQEIDGELIPDVAGALWTRDAIEACRAACAPPLVRVVVGVDPPASAGGDACGIVVIGRDAAHRAYVLADASVTGRSPEGWAHAVSVAAATWKADRVIAEANNGGDMVASVLRAADARLPVRLVRASHGKAARAEPVAALYGVGRAWHVGAFPALEDELCGLVRGGGYEGPGRSPDRADALVWAMAELMLGERHATPQIRTI